MTADETSLRHSDPSPTSAGRTGLSLTKAPFVKSSMTNTLVLTSAAK